jgi:hypothetical protein
MRGRITFFIGGLLLFVYGVLFLVNDIVVLRTLAPIEFPDDAIVISNWIDKVPLWGEQIFRYGMIIVPCILIIVGLSGISGLWWLKDDEDEPVIGLWLSSAIGIRLVTFTIVLQAAMVGRDRFLLMPFYENLGSWLGFAAHRTSWCYWSSVLLLGFCIHIYLTGLEAAAQDEWSAYTITHSATRALFLLVFLPVGYVAGWFDLDPVVFADLPVLLFALYIALFIPVFKLVRGMIGDEESPLREIFSIIGGIVALVIYIVVIGMLHSILVDLYYIAVFMPFVVFVLMLAANGIQSTPTPGEDFNRKQAEENRAAQQRYITEERERQEGRRTSIFH